MPQKIIIVRHGETDYNKEQRMQGWLDIPLNKIGRSQAKSTAAKLRNTPVDALYSSDLRRAHETAERIAHIVKKEIVPSAALRERDMGIFAGWQWEFEHDPVKDQLWSEFIEARSNEDLDWNKHRGESMRQMTQRITQFMQHLHSVHTNQTVVIVTHGGTINRILEHYQIKSASEGFRMITNASILILHKQLTSYLLEEL